MGRSCSQEFQLRMKLPGTAIEIGRIRKAMLCSLIARFAAPMRGGASMHAERNESASRAGRQLWMSSSALVSGAESRGSSGLKEYGVDQSPAAGLGGTFCFGTTWRLSGRNRVASHGRTRSNWRCSSFRCFAGKQVLGGKQRANEVANLLYVERKSDNYDFYIDATRPCVMESRSKPSLPIFTGVESLPKS
jgi:hypothetical protein